tara:strand:+ start:2852 stop:3397 length:546 start_codon:yes stop_codon:yes gene_type:complete
MVIGISGKKRSGKDTVFALINQITDREIRTVRTAFGDQIKREISDAMGIDSSAIDADKEHFRPLLQWWGAEFRRGFCGSDYWIRKMRSVAARYYANDWLVITDVRFPNEAAMVKELNGVMVRVDRDTGLEDAHSSETHMDDYEGFDYRIENNGTPEDLHGTVVGLVNSIAKREPQREWDNA